MKTAVSPSSVMVGVDGSIGSETAVAWATTYARAHRRPLDIVHGAGTPAVTDVVTDVKHTQCTVAVVRGTQP